jgi:hypothetical protein
MAKRGFNILVEEGYIDMLIDFGRRAGIVERDGSVNKTEAFRRAMEIINECLRDFVPAAECTQSDDPTSKNAFTVNTKPKEKGKKG